MCGSMVDIQSPAAEIRRGIKKDRKKERKKVTTGQKYNGPLFHRAAIIKLKNYSLLLNFYSLSKSRIIVVVCLYVSLLATLRKKVQTDLHEIFRKGWQWANEQMMKFWS